VGSCTRGKRVATSQTARFFVCDGFECMGTPCLEGACAGVGAGALPRVSSWTYSTRCFARCVMPTFENNIISYMDVKIHCPCCGMLAITRMEGAYILNLSSSAVRGPSPRPRFSPSSCPFTSSLSLRSRRPSPTPRLLNSRLAVPPHSGQLPMTAVDKMGRTVCRTQTLASVSNAHPSAELCTSITRGSLARRRSCSNPLLSGEVTWTGHTEGIHGYVLRLCMRESHSCFLKISALSRSLFLWGIMTS
jgi:hypothetical protein